MKQKGLTLIEVLVALAIIGIAMTAIIKAVSQNIHSTSYLQKKTIAMWVAQEVINETRAHLLNIGNSSDNQKLTTEMLGSDWYWHLQQEETPNERIKKIIVKVYENEESASALVTMESYIHEQD